MYGAEGGYQSGQTYLDYTQLTFHDLPADPEILVRHAEQMVRLWYFIARAPRVTLHGKSGLKGEGSLLRLIKWNSVFLCLFVQLCTVNAEYL